MNIAKRILTVAVCAAMTASVLSFGASAEVLPEKYDLRTEAVLGEVENQGQVGSCWAFAATGILESWLRANGFGEYALSVRHMDTVTALAYADSYNTELGSAVRPYCVGGLDFNALSYYYSGRGPVLESDYPYIPTYQGIYPRDRRGAECRTAGISVKDVGIGSCVGDATMVMAEKRNDIINEMKTAISYHGAVSVTYYSTASQDGESYYQNSSAYPNHQVMIVGWDDNYPKEKFLSDSGASPQNDGAWIVKNSWGTDFGDDGYFYMSYEESSLYREPFYYIERAAETDYDQIYLSSPLAATKYITSAVDRDDNTDYSLNLFEKTAGSQSVTQVTAAVRKNSYYEIYVIANYENGGENFGKRVGSGYASHDCYKTIEFDPVEITGDTFGVCIKYYSPDKSLSLIPVQENIYATGYYTGEDYTGTSFISHDGVTWKDTAKHDNSLVFVRAYTVNNNETHKVSLPSDYNYATAKLYKDGKEVYKNPDGSFDVESGKYRFEISKTGFETLTGSITVKDKDVKLPYKEMRECPSIEDVNTEIGLKDPGELEISYLYGLEGENPKKVTSVEIGGKKVKYTQTMEGILIDRAQLSHLKAGGYADIRVRYSNGTSSCETVRVLEYTDSGKADIIAERVSEKLSKAKISSYSELTSFCSELREYVSKFSSKASAAISGKYFTEPSAYAEGSYGFTVEISYNGISRTLNFSGTTAALGKASLVPVMNGISSWDKIASSDALKKAEKNGGELTVKLGSDGIIPGSFVEEIAGTSAVIVFKAYNGSYSWKINCADIKKIHDIDTNIYSGTDLKVANDSILDNYSYTSQADMPFYIDSSFDITADLMINTHKLWNIKRGSIIRGRLFGYDKKGVLEPRDDNNYVICYNSGRAELTDITGGSYVFEFTTDCYIFGDVSLDTEGPDKTDIQTLKMYVLMGGLDELKDADPLTFALLDINEDGVIGTDDVKALEEYVAKHEKDKNS